MCKVSVSKLVGPAMLREKGHKANDVVGTLHFSHWVPFENNHLGFFTIFDGDFEKYIQDFADKTSFAFDTIFPHIVGAPPTPVAKNAQAFYSVGIGKQLSAHRVLQRLSGPLGSRHSSPAGRSQVTTGRRSIAVESLDHEPSLVRRDARWPRRSKHQQPRRGRPRGFFAECFVEGDARTRRLRAIRGRWTSPRSTSRTFRASFSAATGCRWCGISC